MAKKRFNLAAEVRNIVSDHPELTGPDAYEEMKRRHPKEKVNESSFGTAFYTARKNAGLSKGSSPKKVVADFPQDFDGLKLAATFVKQVGGPDNALKLVQQVAAILHIAEEHP